MSSKRKGPSPTEKRVQRVREAFSPNDLIRICETADFAFGDYAHKVNLPPVTGWRGQQKDAFFYYRDNGAPILFVAHLDHVQWDAETRITHTAAGPLVTSGALDDRLGAYIGLELLPKLGIQVDWLLTTNEEMGQSTARNFAIDKGYNWMIEFDRGPLDVVMYQYEDIHLRGLVEDVGARVGVGSYSDIADLEHLGCAGFNWGVGYEDYHSERSHAWLEDTFKMVGKFMKFYAAHAATHLVHDPELVEDREICPVCENWLQPLGYCRSCGYDVYDEPSKAVGDDQNYGPRSLN